MKEAIKNTGQVPTFFSSQVLEAKRFYLDAYGRATQPFSVVCGGREHCEPDYRINRRDFPFHSIEFVARGKGTLVLGGQSHALGPGSIFSYGPGVAQVITTDADDPLVKYFVDFTGRRAPKMLQDHALGPGTAMRVASPDVVLRVFDDLIANGSTGSRYSPRICATLVELLILRIAESHLVGQGYRAAAFSTYQTCREFMRDHCLELSSLEQVAEACHIDAAYLCRLFQRFDRQSPYQYLMQLKMTVAAQRLQKTDEAVKQVAYDLGFADPFHFSRAFKRVFGLSPAAFRRLR